jgi:hypothetical protein
VVVVWNQPMLAAAYLKELAAALGEADDYPKRY